MSDRRKINYYTVLGVSRTSTAADLKNAYIRRAKELHPDRNRGRDTTAEFQQLQEAFAVLGSPHRRQLYDYGRFEAVGNPATPATEAEFDPVPCDGCGCISAQPRYVQYDRVIGVILTSHRIQPAGVFCPGCASKRLFVSTLVTGTVGWFGFFGFFWSFAALARNIRGGNKSPGVNAFLLGRQASYFNQQGKPDLASALANESVKYFEKSVMGDSDYVLGRSGAEIARRILYQRLGNRGRMRSRWAGWSVPARYALAGFAVPVMAWAAILHFPTDFNWTRPPRSLQARTVPQSVVPVGQESAAEPQSVDIVGHDGHTYRVSLPDYRSLKVIYDALETRQSALKVRIDELNSRSAEMEQKRAKIGGAKDDAFETFNRQVESWNGDNLQLKADLAAFEQDAAAYTVELGRVGRRIP